jgi:hypothetical protein
MAAVYCRLCQFDHPRPVGSNCVFQTWFRAEEMATTETPVSGGIPVITAASANTNPSLAVPVSAQIPAVTLPSEPLNVNPSDEGIRLPTSEPAPLQREDVLNSLVGGRVAQTARAYQSLTRY